MLKVTLKKMENDKNTLNRFPAATLLIAKEKSVNKGIDIDDIILITKYDINEINIYNFSTKCEASFSIQEAIQFHVKPLEGQLILENSIESD